jgi:DNA polymerase III epsilon subunit-like protein
MKFIDKMLSIFNKSKKEDNTKDITQDITFDQKPDIPIPVSPTVSNVQIQSKYDYLVLDVETPNRKNNSICQIGLLGIKNGKIIDDFSSLIKPYNNFDSYNTYHIHGISDADVINTITFDEYWNKYKDIISNNLILFHNASFDLIVIDKTLSHYHMVIPEIKYICTYQTAKSEYQSLTSYTLTDLCDEFGLSKKQHHDAKNDCEMTNELYEFFKSQNISMHTSYYDHQIFDIDYDETFVAPDAVELKFDNPKELNFENRRFVVSGNFSEIDRDELVSRIQSKGGRVTGSVSKLTNYLIIGNYRNNAWKDKYGNKITKALELKSQSNIILISESQILNFLQDDDNKKTIESQNSNEISSDHTNISATKAASIGNEADNNSKTQLKKRYVVTTKDELDAFSIVKAILRKNVPGDRITYKDTGSYFGILLDQNSRKWICRLNLDSKNKHIYISDENKKPVRYDINTLDDIYDLEDKLIESLQKYL